MAFYRRKAKTVTVRHVSGDRIVSVIEIVSPGNKASNNALRAFVGKAAEFLDKQIHLLILDLLPPGHATPTAFTTRFGRTLRGRNTRRRRTNR